MSMCMRMSTVCSMHQIIHMNLLMDNRMKEKKRREKPHRDHFRHKCVSVFMLCRYQMWTYEAKKKTLYKNQKRKPSIEYIKCADSRLPVCILANFAYRSTYTQPCCIKWAQHLHLVKMPFICKLHAFSLTLTHSMYRELGYTRIET